MDRIGIKYILLTILITHIYSCSSGSYWQSNEYTIYGDKYHINIQLKNMEVFSGLHVQTSEYAKLSSVGYFNQEWYISVSCCEYINKNDLYFNKMEKLNYFQNFLPSTLAKDSTILKGQTGEMYSFRGIDSTMGIGHHLGYKTFFLIEADFVFECSIAKYHYSPADDTTFQKIIDGIEIIRE